MNYLQQFNQYFFQRLKNSSSFGLVLLASTSLVTLAFLPIGKALVRISQQDINPSISEAKLWKAYRWSVDPHLRRKAALLLVGKSQKSFSRRKRLLRSQGWGDNQLAAVAIKLQAQTATSLGENLQANHFWEELLKRFPYASATADAYYILGREKEDLRIRLLGIHPAHPASLASSLEMDSPLKTPYLGVLHLARWGARWHGAEDLILRTCLSEMNQFSSKQRELLSSSLAKLGHGLAAFNCLKGISASSKTTVLIGEALAQGDKNEQLLGEKLLLDLIREKPEADESIEALEILSRGDNFNKSMINSLPRNLSKNSAIVDILKARFLIDDKPLKVLERWQDNPFAWELQWDLAREALLNNQWEKALLILEIIPIKNLPEPLSVRQQFWRAFSLRKLGRTDEANDIWETMIKSHPPSYYTWRALSRLGRIGLIEFSSNKILDAGIGVDQWIRLNSKYKLVDELWDLGLKEEAWETWRSFQKDSNPETFLPGDLLIEGRLRMAVGDEWTGLRKVAMASLRLIQADCSTLQILHRNQHPIRFLSEINLASRKTGLRSELIFAVAKQESRFSSSVVSRIGASGLMQLLPETANELAAYKLERSTLLSPETNLFLGASYLIELIDLWQANPWLSIASYNAGPAKVSEWISSELEIDPELWVERIPYPETRIYTKKVLGNLWSYMNLGKEICFEN